jgi:hypothetical protein
MSIQAMAWAWAQDLPLGPKATLVALANFADGDDECYPGQTRLAGMIGASERAVRNWLVELEAKGLITRETRRRRDGSRTTDLYLLTRHQPERRSGSEPAINRNVVPGVPERGSGHEPSVEPSLSQDQDLRPSSAKPTRENTLTLYSNGQANPPTKVAGFTDAFLDIWNDNCGALPVVRIATAARRKKFAKLRRELGAEAEQIFRAAARQVAGDPYWVEKGYGLDNLLVEGRVVEKAEKFAAGGGLSAGDRKLAGTAKAIADAIGGL